MVNTLIDIACTTGYFIIALFIVLIGIWGLLMNGRLRYMIPIKLVSILLIFFGALSALFLLLAVVGYVHEFIAVHILGWGSILPL